MDVVIPLNASNSFMTSCTGLVRNFVKILKINKFQFNLHPHDGLVWYIFSIVLEMNDAWKNICIIKRYTQLQVAVDLLRFR